MPYPADARDRLAVLALLALTAAYAVTCIDFSAPPFEDAAMLLRYASHVAGGHGLVWNIGEPPVDGATDILFVVLVGLVARAGVSVEAAALGISLVAHVATLLLIYRVMRGTQGAGVAAAVFTAAHFALAPGLALAASGFGTTLFVLTIALTWNAALRIVLREKRGPREYVLFSALALSMGIARPEGVLIAAFMAASVAILLPSAGRVRFVAIFGGLFLVLGGAYFAWRWSYFGYPLPNPYYKKGGGQLHLGGLRHSIANVLALCYPFLWAFAVALRERASTRLAVAFAIPVAGSTLMWVLLSDEMNYGARFQYPVLAIVALSWYPLVRTLVEHGAVKQAIPAFDIRTRRAVGLAALSIALLVFALEVWRTPKLPARDGRYEVGIAMRRFADRGYSIATTEAGLLPFYSGWRTLDAWGLNDQWVAHHGGVTPEYLERFRPTICMVHKTLHSSFGTAWERTTTTVEQYALANGFRLAGTFGYPPYDAYYYYVRGDIPDADAIVDAIKSVDYPW